MGGQVALALVLLVSSGLIVRSVQKLRAIDPGFDPTSTLAFIIGLPERAYPTREAAIAAHHAIIDTLKAQQGVTAVSASTCLPLGGACFGNGVVVEGRELEATSGERGRGNTSFRAVAGDYFQTMAIRLSRGRGIERGDVERRERIVIIDETLADLAFPNEDPIGERITWSMPPEEPGKRPHFTWLTIVGVVANTPTRSLGEASPVPQVYMPMSATGEFGAPRYEYLGPQVRTMGLSSVNYYSLHSRNQMSVLAVGRSCQSRSTPARGRSRPPSGTPDRPAGPRPAGRRCKAIQRLHGKRDVNPEAGGL